jgi:hypothetical protein
MPRPFLATIIDMSHLHLAGTARRRVTACTNVGCTRNGIVSAAGDGMRLARRTPLAAAVIAAALLTACGSGAHPSAPASSTPASPASTASPASSASPATSASPQPSPASASASQAAGSPAALPVAPGAGALPPTRALPSIQSVAFRNAMQDLWLAVTTGNPDLALPAFFPLAAYQQVKAITDPAADWHNRLWHDFTLDVGAAHAVVDPGARLARIVVPTTDAAWIDPGVCYNSIGYWHVPGVRVVYTQHGQQRSFGIASLISWRGVWYVVHFGAVLRNTVTGVVDQPTTGPGVPGPPGGC